jgi:hypothetical protein
MTCTASLTMKITRHNVKSSGLNFVGGITALRFIPFLKVFLMNLGYNLGGEGMTMRIILKTRWLLPILMVGLVILTIEPPIQASDQSLAEVTSGTEPTETGLDLAMIEAEAPAEAEATFDNTAFGTY